MGKAQAHVFTACKAGEATEIFDKVVTDCNQAHSAFLGSCEKVANAIVQGSKGNMNNVGEYLEDVCGQTAWLSTTQQGDCHSFAKAVSSRMSASEMDNLVMFSANAKYSEGVKSCNAMWESFVKEQNSLREAEIAEQKAEEKREAEEAKRAAAVAAAKAAEEKKAKAAAAAKAAAEAKIEEEKAKAAAEAKKAAASAVAEKQKAAHFGCVQACEPEIVESKCVTQCEAEYYQCGDKKCQKKVLAHYKETKGIDKKKGKKEGKKEEKKVDKKEEEKKSGK